MRHLAVAIPVPRVRPMVARAARPRRGVGDLFSFSPSYAATCAQGNLLDYLYCLPYDLNNIASGTVGAGTLPTPPVPAAPGIALQTGAAAASQPGAVYAGVDKSGAPVYAVPETPQANMDAYRQQLADFYNSISPPDCSGVWSAFDSQCNQYSGLAWLGVGLAGLLIGGSVFGRGR